MGEDEDEQYECQVEGCDEVLGSAHEQGYHHSTHSDDQIKRAIKRDITRIAEVVNGSPRLTDLKNHGEFSRKFVRKHLGKWNDALLAAGIGGERDNNKSISEEELIDEIYKLQDMYGSPPTARQMCADGKFSPCTYKRMFGTWNDALKKAELGINQPQDVKSETLIRELRQFANDLGRTPMSTDMIEHGEYSATIYSTRFGNWEKALQSAGLEVDYFDYRYDTAYYGPNWREGRATVLSRDDDQCRVCSNLSQVISGDLIHVHHITPAKEFGACESDVDTDYEVMNHPSNLISLCVACHGKFEGDWTDATPDEFARYAKAELKAEFGSTSSEVSHEIASD